MNRHGIKRRLAGLSLGLLLLLPSCIQRDSGKETYLYPSVSYTYQTSVNEAFLTTGLDPTYLYLANKQHPVAESYDPGTLVTLSTDYALRAIQVEERTAQALMAMMEEMWADGVRDAKVTSGYRTYSYQNSLYQKYVQDEMAKGYSREEAEQRAATYSAPPGYSEHQTGFVVDFLGSGASDLDESFENTAAFGWLAANCWRFGFILRYPKSADKIAITGYDYEPWHYRFVGREAATEIMKRGITLEEFLALEFTTVKS